MLGARGTLHTLAGGLIVKARVQHPQVKPRKDRPGAPWVFRCWVDEIQPDGSVKILRKYQEVGPSKGEGAITKKQEYLDTEFAGKRTEGMKPFYSISDFRVITLKKDLAIVSYLKTEGMKLGDQTFSADARRLDTYALEKGEWRLVTMVASRVLKPPKPVSLTADKLEEYVGTYSIAPGMDSVVLVTDGKLTEHSTDQQVVTLMPLGYDTFFDPEDSPAARTIFRRDASGKVVAWSYVNGDQEVVAKKDK